MNENYKYGTMEGHNEDDNLPIDWDSYDEYKEDDYE
jgi:hypothetical protein